MGAFLPLAVVLTGMLIVIGVVSLLAGRKPTDRANRDSAVLLITMIGAIAYAALVSVGTLWSVVSTLAAPHVDVSLPVMSFWPDPRPGVFDITGPTAQVVAGGFTVADVQVEGLDLPARTFLAAGTLVEGAVFVLLATVIAMLCRQLRSEAPFASSLTSALTGAGITLGIGGIVWQILTAIGAVLAAQQTLRIDGWASSTAVDPADATAHGLPEPSLAASIEFWPIFIGLALVAVAAAFRLGERLQSDTRGLV